MCVRVCACVIVRGCLCMLVMAQVLDVMAGIDSLNFVETAMLIDLFKVNRKKMLWKYVVGYV